MARTPSRGLYEAISETEKALATGPGLHAALSRQDTKTIANDVQAVAASRAALLDGLGQPVTQRYDRCLRDGCGDPLIEALQATPSASRSPSSLRSRSSRSVPDGRRGPWAQLRPARCSAAARSR
jgi:hypothetical protein